MKRNYYWIFALVSVFFWSTTATVGKLVLNEINSIILLTITTFIAALFLFMIAIINKKIKLIKYLKFKDYLIILILAIIGVFGYNLLLYSAMSLIPSQNAFLINYLWPIMIVISSSIIFKEKLKIISIIGLIISFVGVFFITTQGNFSNINSFISVGSILAILAAIFYGLYSTLLKRFVYDKFILMPIAYLFSFILFLIIFLIKGYSLPKFNTTVVASVLWVGCLTNGLAFLTWGIAMEKGNTNLISNLAYITPLLSVIISAMFFKEKITWYILVGLICILIGIIFQKINFKKIFKKNNPKQ